MATDSLRNDSRQRPNGWSSSNGFDLKNFGKAFGAISQDKIDYEEKDQFGFPNVPKAASQEMTMTGKVKKEGFLESFKRLGEAFGAPRALSPSPVQPRKSNEGAKGLLEPNSERQSAPVPASSTKNDYNQTEALPSMLANAETIGGQEVSKIVSQGEKYKTAEKKHSSEHPLTDALSEELHSILKHSKEKSISKAKLLERKIELERQLYSNKKIGKLSPGDKVLEERLSEIKQALVEEDQDSSLEKQAGASQQHATSSQRSQDRRPKHRTSQGLLAFLHQDHNNTDSLEDKTENNGEFIHGGSFRKLNESMNDLAENPKDHIQGKADENDEKGGLDNIDFEGGKRSRKSYFPEKLLRRVKTDNTTQGEGEDDVLGNLAQQFKGPYFNVFSATAANMHLQDMFSNYSFSRDDTFQPSKSKSVLDTLQEKREIVRSIQVTELKSFPEKMAEEQRSNILDINPEQLDKDTNEPPIENLCFESILKHLVKEKLLLCFDMLSREKLLLEICSELDEKIKLMADLKHSVDEIEVPKPENSWGEWTEDRLFKKLSKEYNFQYFKYSIQKETGQIDLTFAMGDVHFFSLRLERNCRKDPESYSLTAGSCKSSPIVIQKGQRTSNPLNSPQLSANIYSRIIAASANDENGTDALRFLVYLGNLQRRINDIRRSMNLCIAKHKISDVLVDLPNYQVQFMLFPKIAKTNFSMQVSVSVLVSDMCDLDVQILSSHHKKRNAKLEVFADLDSKIRSLTTNVDTSGNEWLVDIVDRLVAVVGKDTI